MPGSEDSEVKEEKKRNHMTRLGYIYTLPQLDRAAVGDFDPWLWQVMVTRGFRSYTPYSDQMPKIVAAEDCQEVLDLKFHQ